ncbi:MAG: aldo/keto reductase [Bacteroidales bacterium]|nr:aldo/keto reductase [Bacteroidales bacterium]
MKHRQTGNTGVSLPPIIFGTSALGNLYSPLSDEIKTAIVTECLKYVPSPVVFDSAGKYGAGLALEKLGEILRNLEVPPGEIMISNKLGWLRSPLKGPEPAFERGVWADLKNDAVQKISYDGIMECWEQGNEILGASYLPSLVSVHDPDEYLAAAYDVKDYQSRYAGIIEAYRALSELRSEGRVKAIGVGAKNWQTIKLLAQDISFDWVMIANSMTIYRHPEELLVFMEWLHNKGIAIINSAVFHAGFLTGGEYFDYKRIKPDNHENRQKFRWREEFFSVCRKHDVVPANACVQFALSGPGVVSISLNTSDPSRVRKNVESVECSIPEDFWRDMKGEGLIDKNYPHL